MSNPTMHVKDQSAVKLGRKGGRKGGPARAAKLSPERRKAISDHANSVLSAKRLQQSQEKFAKELTP